MVERFQLVYTFGYTHAHMSTTDNDVTYKLGKVLSIL